MSLAACYYGSMVDDAQEVSKHDDSEPAGAQQEAGSKPSSSKPSNLASDNASKDKSNKDNFQSLLNHEAIAGQKIGHYELSRIVSQGASGLIFQATDTNSQRQVALKILRPEHLKNEGQLKRLERESDLLARIDHPNCVSLVDKGLFHELPYYSMEFVKGRDFERCVRERGKAPVLWLVRMARVAAEALDHFHKKGVLHRDITPRNILIEDESNRPVLTDLGVAKLVQSMAESWDGVFRQDGSITKLGEVVGTPAYMAPEQLRPKAKGIGPRTDIYGLGAVMYFGLLGLPPFEAPNLYDLLKAVQEEAPLSIREVRSKVPAELDNLILSCLAKVPTQRPNSAAQLAKSLKALEKDLMKTAKVNPKWKQPWEAPDDSKLEESSGDASSDSLTALEESADGEPSSAQLGPFGQYELLEELDRDNIGIVFRSRRIGQNRTVLLKRAHNARPSLLERFRRETQVLAGLKHENVIPILQAGDVEGIPFFTMNLPSGDHLEQYLASGRRPPPERCVMMMQKLAQAIGFLHNKGIVHRNLSPRVIYLTADSTPLITGFSGIGQEGTDTMVGDPAYSAPEQKQGQAIDRTVDIYSLGAIFFELLTGKKLHDQTDDGDKPLSEVIRGVDKAFQSVMRKALHNDPRARFQTAEEFQKALTEGGKSSWKRLSKRITRFFSKKKLDG